MVSAMISKRKVSTVNYPLRKTADLESKRLNHIGFIAQEVEEVFPELVNRNPENDLRSVDYISLIPVLVEAIKEQQQQIDDLKQQLKTRND